MRKPIPFASAFIIVLFFSIIAGSCGSKDKQGSTEKIFKLLEPSATGVDFTNVIPENDTLSQYIYIYNGNGVAAGDINNDGLQDLCFTGNSTPAKLYLNKGDFKFEDITAKAGLNSSGWMTGISMADVNNDGYLDIYICKSGPGENHVSMNNLLFINNKNLTFTEKAKEYGVDDPGNSTCGTFFDFDADGDLDLYVGNHAQRFFDEINVQFRRDLRMDIHNQQRFYRNDGNKFTEIGESCHVQAMGYCLSATPGDFNRDGKTDLYVCNDYHIPDYYYLNNGDGTFTESASKYMKHSSTNSMGCDQADYNNDGWLDLITVDMVPEDSRRFMLLQGPRDYDYFTMAVRNGYGHQYMHNNLQTNRGQGYLSDLGFLNGVARTDWSWCPLFADFDNDGNTDLFITNGYYRDVTNQDFILYQQRKLAQSKNHVMTKEILDLLPFEKLPNYAFKNAGNYHFDNVTEAWGLETPTLSTGGTYADLNNDGRLDLVVCNQGDKAQVYQNVGTKGNYLDIKFKGSKSNHFGIGCKVLAETDSSTRMLEMELTHGYQSSSAPVLHLGCGGASSIKKLTIIWPTGAFEVLTDVKSGQVLIADETHANGNYDFSNKTTYTLEEITAETGIDFTHEDQDNPDFKREPLLPHRFTQMGPGAASGDVNGDGLADLLISNSRESSGCKLFLQQQDGKFKLSASQPWKSMNDVDVLGCLIFDADNDSDNDIYLVAGGAEYEWPSNNYKHRIYTNDGKGNFSENKTALPDVNCSGSCITAGDIDADGDLDLFVAGRIQPGHYPENPARSYLLRNNDGTFIDATTDWLPGLKTSPMICAAVFADYSGDNKPDLVIAGEWCPVMFFENKGNKFSDQTQQAGTKLTEGWYNSLLPVDIDNDGDLDFIAGNKGLNSYVQAGPETPLKIYSSDLDGNGRNDMWLTYTRNQKEYPLYQLDEMAMSYPGFLRKKFTTYKDIANKTAVEIFGENHMKNFMTVHTFASLLLRNNGGSFQITELPRLAQAFPVFGLETADINGDGFLDILAIGNSYAPRVTHGRDDAGNGLILFNMSGTLKCEDGIGSGFLVPGDAKALVTVPSANGYPLFVATENKSKTRVFKSNNRMTFIPALKTENKAMVTLKSGKTRCENTCFGAGYISCSAPGVYAGDNVVSVEFVDSKGRKRKVSL